MNTHRLAVCVPYRNRQAHLEQFLPHVEAFLASKGIDHKIYIVHQRDKNMFNRGALKNIGFKLAIQDGCDYCVFHDIDMLPEECDYSFPEQGPTHLAAGIDSLEGKLFYPTYFGGVVIFSREQFERVNGYCNGYWGWGSEDDDLFSRCILAGLADQESIEVKQDRFTGARFDGLASRAILHPTDSRLNDLMKGSYTIDVLVKPDPVIFRKDLETLPFIHRLSVQIPLLSRHCLPVLTHSQSWYFGNQIDRSNVLATVACGRRTLFSQREDFPWEHFTCVVDAVCKQIQVLMNGRPFDTWSREDVMPGSRKAISGSSRFYYGTPFCVGFDDTPMGRRFQGEMGKIAFWDHALSLPEIQAYIQNQPAQAWDEGLICTVDFSDAAAQGDHYLLEMAHLERSECTIERLDHVPIPFRRMGRFRNIDPRDEGEKRVVDQQWTLRNGEIITKFKAGLLDTRSSGLSDLSYNIAGESDLTDQAVMFDVELNFAQMTVG